MLKPIVPQNAHCEQKLPRFLTVNRGHSIDRLHNFLTRCGRINGHALILYIISYCVSLLFGLYVRKATNICFQDYRSKNENKPLTKWQAQMLTRCSTRELNAKIHFDKASESLQIFTMHESSHAVHVRRLFIGNREAEPLSDRSSIRLSPGRGRLRRRHRTACDRCPSHGHSAVSSAHALG